MGIDAIQENYVLYVGSDYSRMREVARGSRVLTSDNFNTDFLVGNATVAPQDSYNLAVIEGEKGSIDYALNLVRAAKALGDRFSSTPKIILPDAEEVAAKYQELDEKIIGMMPEPHREFFA